MTIKFEEMISRELKNATRDIVPKGGALSRIRERTEQMAKKEISDETAANRYADQRYINMLQTVNPWQIAREAFIAGVDWHSRKDQNVKE